MCMRGDLQKKKKRYREVFIEIIQLLLLKSLHKTFYTGNISVFFLIFLQMQVGQF